MKTKSYKKFKKITSLERVNKRRTYPEDNLQIQIADYLRLALPEEVVWTTHENSTQSGNSLKQSILKRKGLMPGWPDMELTWSDGILNFTMHLELKAPGRQNEKNGGCSDVQMACHKRLYKVGRMVEIVYSIEDVQRALHQYCVPHRKIMLT